MNGSINKLFLFGNW